MEAAANEPFFLFIQREVFEPLSMNGTLLRPGTIALLQTPLRLESGASTDYGLGWKVETVTLRAARARLIGHDGSPFGGTASLMTFSPPAAPTRSASTTASGFFAATPLAHLR